MEYFIQNYKENKELLGTENTTFVHDAKNMVKVNNGLLRHKPSMQTDEIRIYSYTNLYNEKTHKLIKTIRIK